MARPKILVTGASGLIGGLVLRDLRESYEFSGLSRRAVAGIPYTVASITDLEAIRPAFAGVDGVLHLGVSVDVDNWDDQMSVTALGNTIADAQRRAYQAIAKIHFEGMHYRKDIGHWAVR